MHWEESPHHLPPLLTLGSGRAYPPLPLPLPSSKCCRSCSKRCAAHTLCTASWAPCYAGHGLCTHAAHCAGNGLCTHAPRCAGHATRRGRAVFGTRSVRCARRMLRSPSDTHCPVTHACTHMHARMHTYARIHTQTHTCHMLRRLARAPAAVQPALHDRARVRGVRPTRHALLHVRQAAA